MRPQTANKLSFCCKSHRQIYVIGFLSQCCRSVVVNSEWLSHRIPTDFTNNQAYLANRMVHCSDVTWSSWRLFRLTSHKYQSPVLDPLWREAIGFRQKRVNYAENVLCRDVIIAAEPATPTWTRLLMPQSHPTTGPVRFLAPVRFLSCKAELSARRNFTPVLFS